MRAYLYWLTLAWAITLPGLVMSQHMISGKVTNQQGEPMPRVNVYIPESDKGIATDSNGSFTLSQLGKGKMKVQFSYIGYKTVVVNVLVEDTPVDLRVVMVPTPIEAEELVVTGGYPSTQHEQATRIDIINPGEISTKATPNFLEKLTMDPGIDMISKGPGVAKPVIRGFSMNDILVLNNGVRYENYQYSNHHPLGIDEFGIDRVEIIKGPASLIYGSDAIGGVINFLKEKPAPVGTVQGDYNLSLFSNTLGMTNNLGLKGASGKFYGGVRFGHTTNEDFLQGGGDYVPNTRFSMISLKTNAGMTTKTGTFKLDYDYGEQKMGLAEEEAVEMTTGRGRELSYFYQHFKTHLISSRNKLFLSGSKMELNAAWQNTSLAHIGEPGETELEMGLSTITYEAKYYFPAPANSDFIIGFQGFNQDNSNLNDRETVLLPNAKTENYSGFGLASIPLAEAFKIQAGLRYDYRNITTESWGEPTDTGYHKPLDKNYDSFSGSLGATYNAVDKLILRVNFASAYRTPNLPELTSNGKHETRYEIGNEDLVSQIAFETDINLHYHTRNITIDLAGFYNLMDHYIFISPTGQFMEDGLPVYRYEQSDATLYGGEAAIHLHPKNAEWLHLEGSYSSVTGKRSSGDYLPFIPAQKIQVDVMADREKLWKFKSPFVKLNVRYGFSQDHPAPDEESTPAHTLMDAGIGCEIPAGSQAISLVFGVNNLLDKKYIDHLSTLEEVGYFDPGRNFTLTLKVPFVIVQ